MATVNEVEQFNVRLKPNQKKRLERLAKASGKSLNEYIAAIIDAQYELVGDERLAVLEQMQTEMVKPAPIPKATAKRQRP